MQDKRELRLAEVCWEIARIEHLLYLLGKDQAELIGERRLLQQEKELLIQELNSAYLRKDAFVANEIFGVNV